MDVDRTVRVYLSREDIERLLEYFVVEINGLEIKYDKHWNDPEFELSPIKSIVLKEAMDDIFSLNYTDEFNEHLTITKNYIDYLEKLVVACSDCMYDYNVASLRQDFVKDYENYYGAKR